MKGPRSRHCPSYEPAATFLLRTTALPIAALSDVGGGRDGHPRLSGYRDDATEASDRRLTRDLRCIAADARVARALYLSSSSLFERLYDQTAAPAGLDRYARHRAAMLRYLTRMAARPTPFGASAGVAVGRVTNRTDLHLDGLDAADVVVRLDVAYVDGIGQRQIEACVSAAIPLRWNETARMVGDRLVFLTRRERLVEASVRLDPEVRRALGENGDMTFGRCVEQLVALGEKADDAQRFVRALLAEGALVCPALGVVTETDPGARLVSEPWVDADDRRSLRAALAALQTSGGDPVQLELTRSSLPEPAPSTSGSALFHGALVFAAPGLTLSTRAAEGLLATTDILRRCPAPPRDGFLDRFVAAFLRRFGEGTAVPFLEVFDSRSGLDIPGDPRSVRPGVTPGAFVRVRRRAGEGEALSRDDWLLTVAMASDGGVVDIAGMVPSPDDAPPAALPDTFCVVATFLGDRPTAWGHAPDVWFHRLVGPSGAQYLGRFGHWHPELAALLGDIHRREQALRPEQVFAEICHQPPGREGNVVMRRACHEHEISLLGRGTVPPEREIALQDLVITVRSGRITLWSRSLGRQVEPRLSCAHNFRRSDCPAYRFLGALQFQDLRSATEWSWRGVADWPELPRIMAGSTLLAPRQWRLRPQEVDQLSAGRMCDRLRAIDRLRAERGWGRFVMIGPASQPLVADLDSVAGAEVLCHEIRRRPASTVREADFFAGSPALSAPDGARHHEAVVPFVRCLPAGANGCVQAPSTRLPTTSAVRHLPGGQWLFGSVFCAPVAADELLTEVIGPLAVELTTTGVCDRWFFLRYDEDGHHLRVRFHGAPEALWGTALRRLHDGLLTRSHLWRGFELGEYHPEVERYGGTEGLDAAERFFAADSAFVVETLAGLRDQPPDPGTGLFRLALASTVRMLTDLGFDAAAQAAVVATTSAGARHHVNIDTASSRHIGRLYREERRFIVDVLVGQSPLPAAFEKRLAERSQAWRPVIDELRTLETTGSLSRSLEFIAPSYAHMGLNRLFAENQRQNELLVAELLARGYREVAARTARFGEASPPS